MKMRVFSCLTLILAFAAGNVRGETVQEIETRLVKKLTNPDVYNKYVMPRIEDSKPLQVSFGLTLQQLEKVDMENNQISVFIWPNIQWTDRALAWNESEFNVPSTRLSIDDIWMPDIECYNCVEVKSTLNKEFVVLYSRGSITYVGSKLAKAVCRIDPYFFPYDQQSCQLKFGSWTHDGFKMNLSLQADEMDLGTYVRNEEFELSGAPAKKNTVLYECCPEPYLDLSYEIKVARRTGTYAQQLMIGGPLMGSILILLSTLLNSYSSQTSKIMLLLLGMVCVGSGNQGPALNTMIRRFSSAAGSYAFTICMFTVISCSMCNSSSFLLPLIKRIIKDKEADDKKKIEQFSRWLDVAMFCFALIYFITFMVIHFPVLF